MFWGGRKTICDWRPPRHYACRLDKPRGAKDGKSRGESKREGNERDGKETRDEIRSATASIGHRAHRLGCDAGPSEPTFG